MPERFTTDSAANVDNSNVGTIRLTQIALCNFQVHTKCTITLSPTITTIKGPTDSGKSAVLRGLRWVCQNVPAGQEFIKNGAHETCATVGLRNEDGRQIEISRRRGGRKNTYELEGKTYEAFGSDVPPDVATILRVSDINFQGQHDAPFWFSESAGEVSRQLNAIIDLSIIDTTLSNVGAEVRTARERVLVSEERLKQARGKWRELKPLRRRVAHFQDLIGKEEILQDRKQNERGLSELLDELEVLDVRRLELKAQEGSALLTLAKEARRVESRWEGLVGLLGQQNKLKARIEMAKQNAVRAEEEFHKQTKGKACPLCGRIMT